LEDGEGTIFRETNGNIRTGREVFGDPKID